MQEPFPESVVILGAAGGGRLVYWCLQSTHPGTRVVFVDDGMEEDSLVIAGEEFAILHEWRFEGIQKAGTDEFRHFVVSPTYPPVKKALVTKALAAGLLPAPTVIHPAAYIHGRATVKIGRGGLILPNATVMNDTVMGDYVHVTPGAILGHDCVADDFVALNPGSIALGYNHLKTGVALGGGVIVREHVTIAAWVRTGIQACVAKDVLEEGITVAGVPARPLITAPAAGRQP
jgi:UDP-3-O-[3-hydroxymyristoyl] glucosamine N-acyltransferase